MQELGLKPATSAVYSCFVLSGTRHYGVASNNKKPNRRVPKRKKQLSTVEVAGLVRALAHIGSLTN